jgi:hypothetical protein
MKSDRSSMAGDPAAGTLSEEVTGHRYIRQTIRRFLSPHVTKRKKSYVKKRERGGEV